MKMLMFDFRETEKEFYFQVQYAGAIIKSEKYTAILYGQATKAFSKIAFLLLDSVRFLSKSLERLISTNSSVALSNLPFAIKSATYLSKSSYAKTVSAASIFGIYVLLI